MNRILESSEFTAAADQVNQGTEVVFLPEANTILAAASMSSRPAVMMSSMLSGTELYAGEVGLNITGDERSEARWEGGLEQLESCGFLKDAGYKREVFRLTKTGFEAADQIWYILVLRQIEALQTHEYSYVNFDDISRGPFFGKNLGVAFLREKLQRLASMKQLDIVPVDGGIGGARLNDIGRKTIREHSFMEFAQPESCES